MTPRSESRHAVEAATCDRFPLDLIEIEVRSGPYEDQSMKRSRFMEEQIIGILKGYQAGVSVADLCLTHGVSNAVFANGKPSLAGWRSRRPSG